MSIAAVAGIAMYWLQEYAFYEPITFKSGDEIKLTLIESGLPEPILTENITGIDANSSPLRFRACFRTPMTQALLSETYQIYEKPVPLFAPSWFDCFDATKIGEALEKGEAIAFLSQANITDADITKPNTPSFDRVVAVFPDGSAFAWQQLSSDAEQQ